MLLDLSKSQDPRYEWIVRDAVTGDRLYGVVRANDEEGWYEVHGYGTSPHAGAGVGLSQPKRVYRAIRINRITKAAKRP